MRPYIKNCPNKNIGKNVANIPQFAQDWKN